MKIGIDARYLRKEGTGIGQVTKNLLQALAALPDTHAHEFFIYVEEAASLELPENWSFRIVRSGYERDDLLREHLYERYSLPRAVVKDRCEVFFSLSQSATRLPKSIRHLMLVHDLVPLRFPEYLASWQRRYHYRAVVRAIRRATRIIAPSDSTKKDLENMLAVPETTLAVVPVAASPIFERLPEESKIREILLRHSLEPGYLYHGGGLEKRKNARRILEAYRTLRDEGLALPPLVISGAIHAKDNPLATDVSHVVRELDLEKDVSILGYVSSEDLPSLYAGAYAFIYPSLWEGFGLPLLEAMSQGTPVVASSVSALPEIGGDAVLYCNPEDVGSIAGAMRQLVEHDDLRKRLSEAGKERSKRYSWSKTAEALWPFLVY